MSIAKTEYFLGGISKSGFTTHFDKKVADSSNFTYILKGGAGTGKSTLMKMIVKTFSDIDDITVYYCASDPASLDAVYLKNAKVIIVDGTAPHVFDPLYPGACQKIINLGDYWNSDNLKKNASNIISVTDNNQKWHKRCQNFAKALSALFEDTVNIAQDATDYKKLSGFLERISRKLLPKRKTTDGKTYFEQLSALTPLGYSTLSSTLENYEYIYLLNDPFYSSADLFLRDFATVTSNKGYDVIVSECTLFSPATYEHLLIPELKIAFLSNNALNHFSFENAKNINFLRFYKKDILSHKKQRLSFNKKACEDLLGEATSALKNAKDVHDEIENYYIESMNFDAINQKITDLVSEIMEKY